MRLKMLAEAKSLLLKLLKRAAESRYEAKPESGDTRKCCPIITSYCSDISEAKDLSAAQHGAKRQHLCVKSHSTHKDLRMVKGSSARVVAGTMAVRRRVKGLQALCRNLVRRGLTRRLRKVLDQRDSSSFEQSLAKCPSILEEICGSVGVRVRELYSIVTTGPLHNLHLEISRLLETFLIHYLSLDKIYSRPGARPEKQK